MTYYSTNPQRLSLLGHISFGVKSMAISEPFYNAVFRSFGIVQVYRDKAEGSPATVCGWGARPAARGVAPEEPFTLFERSDAAPPGPGTHVAFNAPSRAAVDEFYKAALGNGGRGDGEPGLRVQYGRNYYACFVWDPDGYKLEAVFQQPIDSNLDAPKDLQT